jgi:hypothetical protein
MLKAFSFPVLLLMALSQSLAAQTAPSLPAAAPPLETLAAAGVQARISESSQSKVLAAGGSAFASISVTFEGETPPPQRKGRKKPGDLSATLLLEAVQGELGTVTGGEMSSTPIGASVAIRGMRPGETSTVLVEVRLKSAVPNEPAKLRVTLQGRDGAASNTAELRWSVRDCAGDFYRELQMIASAGGAQLSALLKQMRTRDETLPAASLFRETRTRPARSPRCLRYRRQWDFYDYRYRRVCVQYKQDGMEEEAIAVAREEREILQRASNILRAGGADSKLGRNGALEWVSGKIAADLRMYLEQPKHPALCTGAPQFTDYYLGRASGLRSHAQSVIDLAAKARTLAAAKTAEVRQSIQDAEGGHPAAGIAPVPVAQLNADPDSLRGLIVSLTSYAGLSVEAAGMVQAAPDELSMLRLLKENLAETKDAAPALKRVVSALALIEAAVHLTMVEVRYQDLQTKFIGSFESIKAAYDKYCVCGG